MESGVGGSVEASCPTLPVSSTRWAPTGLSLGTWSYGTTAPIRRRRHPKESFPIPAHILGRLCADRTQAGAGQLTRKEVRTHLRLTLIQAIAVGWRRPY